MEYLDLLEIMMVIVAALLGITMFILYRNTTNTRYTRIFWMLLLLLSMMLFEYGNTAHIW